MKNLEMLKRLKTMMREDELLSQETNLREILDYLGLMRIPGANKMWLSFYPKPLHRKTKAATTR